MLTEEQEQQEFMDFLEEVEKNINECKELCKNG